MTRSDEIHDERAPGVALGTRADRPTTPRAAMRTEPVQATAPPGPTPTLAPVLRGVALLSVAVALPPVVLFAGALGLFPALAIMPLYMITLGAIGPAAANLVAVCWTQIAVAREAALAAEAARAAVPAAPAPRRERTTLRTHIRNGLQELARIHHTVPVLLAAAEEEEEPLRLILKLKALRRHLEEHFRVEEAPLGLFEELRGLDANVEPDLITLCDEHEGILSDLSALTDLEALEHPSATATLPSKDQVLGRIRRHLAGEDAVVQRVYGFRIEGELSA